MSLVRASVSKTRERAQKILADLAEERRKATAEVVYQSMAMQNFWREFIPFVPLLTVEKTEAKLKKKSPLHPYWSAQTRGYERERRCLSVLRMCEAAREDNAALLLDDATVEALGY